MVRVRLVPRSRPGTVLDRDLAVFCPWETLKRPGRVPVVCIGKKTVLARRLRASGTHWAMTSRNSGQHTPKLRSWRYEDDATRRRNWPFCSCIRRRNHPRSALRAQFTDPHGAFADDPAITSRDYGVDILKLRPCHSETSTRFERLWRRPPQTFSRWKFTRINTISQMVSPFVYLCQNVCLWDSMSLAFTLWWSGERRRQVEPKFLLLHPSRQPAIKARHNRDAQGDPPQSFDVARPFSRDHRERLFPSSPGP